MRKSVDETENSIIIMGALLKQFVLQVYACYRMLSLPRSLALNSLTYVLGESPEITF